MADDGLLDRLDRYLDAVPRSAAQAEPFGPLTLFARSGPGWPYYARPTPDWSGDVTPADIEAVRRRQRELGDPESFEWLAETAPELRAVAEQAGLHVAAVPLLVLTRRVAEPAPAGIRVRVLPPEDPDVARATAVAHLGFADPGTATGRAGTSERDAVAAGLADERLEVQRERMRRGLTVTAVAEVGRAGPLSVGSHQPVDGVTEIVGVATLPSARRRGLGAAVTARLVADAAERGIATVFLSAGSDDVARMYARVGFERVGTSCVAGPPPRPSPG